MGCSPDITPNHNSAEIEVIDNETTNTNNVPHVIKENGLFHIIDRKIDDLNQCWALFVPDAIFDFTYLTGEQILSVDRHHSNVVKQRGINEMNILQAVNCTEFKTTFIYFDIKNMCLQIQQTSCRNLSAD